MKYFEKNIDNGLLDLDKSTRKVKFAFASTETVDLEGDIFDKGAFIKSIKERGPSGSNDIWHLTDHTAKTYAALGKMSEVYMENGFLVGVSVYKDSHLWREVVWPLYESGDINQHSIGGGIVKAATSGKNRVIVEAAVLEGSTVLWGANPNTRTMEVTKSFGIINEKDEPQIRIEKIIKAINSNKFDDEIKSLLVIELKQLQNDIEKSTKPAEEVTKPELLNEVALGIAILKAKNNFNGSISKTD
jgi:hypothetical protein